MVSPERPFPLRFDKFSESLFAAVQTAIKSQGLLEWHAATVKVRRVVNEKLYNVEKAI